MRKHHVLSGLAGLCITFLIVALMPWSCVLAPRGGSPADERGAPPVVPLPSPTAEAPADYPGVHNAVAYADGYVSGSQPEGDAGFDTLATMGIRTIISVDGAEPDVARAQARGMRYIHLPIGYHGFDEQRKMQIVRATRDARRVGPVYIHCHHGKHRSAAAAACAAASLGWITPEQGLARMKVSGTAADYRGLWAVAQNARPLDASVVEAVSGTFPERCRPSGFVQGMVDVDAAFDHLRQIEKAGWTVPRDHPDLVPVAEAGRLADLYRALLDTSYVRDQPADFLDRLRDAQTKAQALEDLLAAGERDAAKLGAQFSLIRDGCKDCHRVYRD